MAELDIIMVHYHAAALARESVEALHRDAAASGLTIRVFVMDNGSTPEERALLESLKITRLDAGTNLNFPNGVNFAYRHTSAEFLVLMNEDVMVLPGCLNSLLQQLRAGAAVAGPLFYWDRDRVLMLPCTEERTRRGELVRAAGRKNLRALERARSRWRDLARLHWRATEPFATLAISGALLAFRRSTWEIAGPFGGGYTMYFDENDWLRRIQRAGLTSVYVPAAKALHLHNPMLAGNPDRSHWSNESFLRFGTEYYGEHFMRRLFLLGSRPAAVPSWPQQDTLDEIELPDGGQRPLWIEFTPSPFGYPAAAARIDDPSIRRWRFPALRGLPFMIGTFFLQIVDDAGRELRSCRFERLHAPSTVQTEETAGAKA